MSDTTSVAIAGAAIEKRSLWSRIPVLLRALILGLLVQILGVMPFMILARLNLRVLPALPWAALVEIGILWALWRYLGGAGWPASTAATRRRWRRANRVERSLWPATAVTGVLYGLTLVAFSAFTNLWQPMPPEAVAAILELARAPASMAIATLAMVAISAGFVEEAAYRGFLQKPIEERHGPAVAIVFVAIVFALSHAIPGPTMPLFALGATGMGLLARLTGSIVPGIVVHILVDAGVLTWVWLRPEGIERFLAFAAAAPAGDPSLRIAGGIALVLAVASTASFVWLHRLRSTARGDGAAQ